MSVKIKLIMGTIPDKTMKGYMSNEDAYKIRAEMSVKIKLIMDTIPDKPMEGYMSNEDAYKIRDKICDAMKKYSQGASKRIIQDRFYDP